LVGPLAILLAPRCADFPYPVKSPSAIPPVSAKTQFHGRNHPVRLLRYKTPALPDLLPYPADTDFPDTASARYQPPFLQTPAKNTQSILVPRTFFPYCFSSFARNILNHQITSPSGCPP